MVRKLSRQATNANSPNKEVARVTIRLYNDEINQAERIAQKLKMSSVT